jgi:hypothetical protein
VAKDKESAYLEKWGVEIHEMSRILNEIDVAAGAGRTEPSGIPAPYKFSFDDKSLVCRLEHTERGLVLTRRSDGEHYFHQIKDLRGLRYDYQKDEKTIMNARIVLA